MVPKSQCQCNSLSCDWAAKTGNECQQNSSIGHIFVWLNSPPPAIPVTSHIWFCHFSNHDCETMHKGMCSSRSIVWKSMNHQSLEQLIESHFFHCIFSLSMLATDDHDHSCIAAWCNFLHFNLTFPGLLFRWWLRKWRSGVHHWTLSTSKTYGHCHVL